MKITVMHMDYGCDTGCCGHVVEVKTEPGEAEPKARSQYEFQFEHPYGGDHRAFAEKLVTEMFGAEHVKDLDWENCIISEG